MMLTNSEMLLGGLIFLLVMTLLGFWPFVEYLQLKKEQK